MTPAARGATIPVAVEFSVKTVTTALAAVMGELPGIGKDGQASQQQGGYAYRGIEAITRHAAPLLAKHGVVFVPQVLDVEIRDLTVNNKPWTDTILTVRYRICGPGGPDDYVEATVIGIGRDNADKGANKALTQAFKYALIQVLCIADAKDDGDGHTHEADARPAPPANVDAALIEEVKARLAALDPSNIDAFQSWKDDQGFPWPWPVAACRAMLRELDRIEIGRAADTAPAEAGEGSGVRPPAASDPPAEPTVYEDPEMEPF